MKDISFTFAFAIMVLLLVTGGSQLPHIIG